MISGSLSLKNPSLRLRRQFEQSYGQLKTTQVAMFEPGTGFLTHELGSLLRDAGEFNTDTKDLMSKAADRFRAESANEPVQVQRGPVLAPPSPSFQRLKATRAERKQVWDTATAKYSQTAHQICNQLAVTANAWLGPVILASTSSPAAGCIELKFHKQTTQEYIHDGMTNPSPLTGEFFSPQDRQRGELKASIHDPSQPVLFDPKVSHTIVVDLAMGLAALKTP